MHDIDSALDDIARVRRQLAASTRFQGFAPSLVAVTGLMALALAAWQSAAGIDNMVAWILLAVVCALMIGTEAVVRARKLHRAMADRMIGATLRRFLPTAAAGAVIAAAVLTQSPDAARILPGTWQLLMAVGLFAALGNLPPRIAFVGLFYFVTGAATLALGFGSDVPAAWLMGLPFGIGQLLVAAILHLAAKEDDHG